MTSLEQKFMGLGADNAPGQEVRQDTSHLDAQMRGAKIDGTPVDFSHGDVDTFPPTPEAREAWEAGYDVGSKQANTEHRGDAGIRERVARHLAAFTGAPVFC